MRRIVDWIDLCKFRLFLDGSLAWTINKRELAGSSETIEGGWK